MQDVVAWLVQELATSATQERAIHEKAYLKSDLQHIGATVPQTRAVAKQLAKAHPGLAAAPWDLVAACWGANIYELRSCMAFFLEHAHVGPGDEPQLERILRDAHTWALVDQLAVRIVPRLEPSQKMLMVWARDNDFWIRRTSLLAELQALRAGGGNPDAWAKRAIPNLDDPEFFIRKAIGWVLREIGKKRPDWTATFCLAHRESMSPLTWKEATRNLSPEFAP